MTTVERVTTPYTYSAAVRVGETVHLALHRGFGDTFAAQLDGAIEGVRGTLHRLGLELDCVVKVHVWLRNVSDLPEMEQAFHRYFDDGTFPARMTSTTEFFDADCLVMVEGIADSRAGSAR